MSQRFFQQAMVEIKSELIVYRVKLSLPIVKPQGYDTPYLRRRMHLRK